MQYYSDKTHKIYKTEKELKEAEQEFDYKEIEVKKYREKRAAKAKEIEIAYNNYKKLVNEFVKEYGSYHYSVTDVKDLRTTPTPSLIDMFFDNFKF